MPQSLHLGLSGAFSARDVNDEIITPMSRRSQAMLAFLALQPEMRAERTTLADLLWGDRSEDQARASLRQELSVLRRVLPQGVLDTNRICVWLDPAKTTVTTLGPGDLLQGFDLGSEPFEDWLREIRSMHLTTEPAKTKASPLGRGTRPTLAILPFEEIGAPDSDMFADGVVEEITGALSRVREFHVIARQSTFALRGENLDVPTIASRLGANYIVEGSVRRAGERVRITVQLINGDNGQTLWSDRFDDKLDDLFDLQDRITAQVAGQVSPNLRHAEIARARTTPPNDRTAYELLLTAYPHFWSHNREGNARAIEILDEALKRDPDYAPALSLKAWCLAQQPAYMYSRDPEADRETAVIAIDKACESVGDHAPSLTAIGAALSLVTTDLERANFYIDRALDIDPNNAWAWMRRGWAQAFVGQSDDAIACQEMAERLSPLDPFRFNFLLGKASALYHWQADDSAGRENVGKAVMLIKEAIRMNPKAKWAYRMLASACFFAKDQEAARDAGRELLNAYPDITIDYLKRALPPAAFVYELKYFKSLRDAGIPEE